MVPYHLEWARLVALGVAVLIVAIGVAVFAFRPSARSNRRLAAVLALEGIGLAAGWVLAQMALDVRHAAAWTRIAWAAFAAQIPVYLLFLGTLRTPLVRPFSTRAAATLLWPLALVGAVLPFARPELFFIGFEPRAGAETFVQVPGILGSVVPALHSIPLPLFALGAAYHQWRRAPRGMAARRQAGSYLLAFGWRDLTWIFLLAGMPALTGTSVTDSDPLPTVVYSAAGLGFMALLGYGVLSTQLFDIDIKARLVIRQSTVAAAAAGLFFIISETVEQRIDVHGAVPALATAIIIGLVFRPLQTLGQRFALRVLPVRDDAQERDHKLELYQVAFQGFREDGTFTSREERVLHQMRDRLGLSESDVAHLHDATDPGAPPRQAQ